MQTNFCYAGGFEAYRISSSRTQIDYSARYKRASVVNTNFDGPSVRFVYNLHLGSELKRFMSRCQVVLIKNLA